MTRPYWHYQDPLESGFQDLVSGDLLLGHLRTIGAWERESGEPLALACSGDCASKVAAELAAGLRD